MSANDEAVTWRIADGIAHLLLNRPAKGNAIGLASARSKLPAAALDLARTLARSSRASTSAIKNLNAGLPGRTLEQQLALEHQNLRACANGPDSREGVAAFVARRQPDFTSRSSRPEA